MKHRLRPQRSVSLLHGIMRIAMISRNSVIAVCTPLTVVSRSSLMSVIITFMFEPAKLQMNCASASGRISRRAEASAAAADAHREPAVTERAYSRRCECGLAACPRRAFGEGPSGGEPKVLPRGGMARAGLEPATPRFSAVCSTS